MTDPARDEFEEGARVAGCVVERTLGRGATGVVYLARTEGGDRVALKVLHREALDAPGAVARFEREARALRAVKHDALVPLVLAGRLDDGRPYLATRWIDGTTLRERLRSSGRIDASQAWAWIEPVGDALAAAHHAGVVHRDLKPENVMIDSSGRAHLLDFGIARTPREITDAKLTATGAPLGTPAYMSPEQWWNQSVDAATDQYALGVMAFEMLSGRLPFAEERYVAMMQAHLASDPPSLASVGVTVEPRIEAWVARLLAKDPRARFDSMGAALVAGREAFVGSTPKGAAVRSRIATLVVAIGVALGLVAIGYAGSHDPRAWAYSGGFATYPVFVAFVVALVALARVSATTAVWASLAMLGFGALGTYTGWQAVLRHLGRYPEARHFEVFNEGMSEANSNRFVGFGLAAAVFAATSYLRPVRVTRDAVVLAGACALFAAIAWILGAPGGAFVAFAGALAVLSRGAPGPTRNDVVREEAFRLAGVLAAIVAAVARSETREAALWANAPSRSARVAEILAATNDRNATFVASAAVLASVVATAIWRTRSAPRSGTAVASRRSLAIGVALLTLFIAGDTAFHTLVRIRRDALWAAMAPRFSLFAHLDPPAATTLEPARLIPALQIARDVIAIDGERVGLTAGLASSDGRSALAADLAHRLARAEGSSDSERAPLSLTVDRHVPFSTVRAALHVAYGLGVRRVDLMFTRGDAPRWNATAPIETGFALPRDFGVRSIALTPGPSRDVAGDPTWEEASRRLLESSEPISVGDGG